MAAQALGPGTTIVRQAGLLRPARRERLGLGDPQGGLLVRRHHHADGVPPGPRPLRHRPADDRDRRPAPDVQQEPQRHPGQPLPARDRDRCRARPRSGRSCPGSRTRRSSGCPQARTDAAIVGGRPPDAPRRRLGRSCGAGQRLSPPSSGRTATSTAGRRAPPLPAPRAGAAAVFFSGAAYVIGGTGRERSPDRHRLRGHAGRRVGQDHDLGGESTDLKLPAPRADAAAWSPATGSSSSAAEMPPVPLPRSGRRRSSPRPARSSHGASCPPCRTCGPGRLRSSWGRTSSSTAARMVPAQRPRSCAARSASWRAIRSRP